MKNSKTKLEELEDKKNPTQLVKILARATREARRRSREISDEIIEVRNGQLIREIKGKKCEVLRDLKTREVEVGKVWVIER